MSICAHSGKSFTPKYAKLKLCYDCWRLREDLFETVDENNKTIDELQGNIRGLLMLCHPDKHGNNKTSTEMTTWLLSVREK